MPKKAETTYIVANPRKLPEGKWIIRTRQNGERRDFFEGDAITPADAVTATGWSAWLASGYVTEVKGA